MKFSHLLLFAAGMPLLASAQADRALPAAADPNAPVPPLQYRSVFADYVAAKEPTRSPDKDWVSASGAHISDAPPAAGGADNASEPHPAPAGHEHEGARR